VCVEEHDQFCVAGVSPERHGTCEKRDWRGWQIARYRGFYEPWRLTLRANDKH
jgi:hypothetical protein